MIRTAFILAAGFGKRMQPWTFHIPKPLLCIHNKPMLVWHIENLIASGIRHILINIHHKRNFLKSWLEFYFSERLKIKDLNFTIIEEDIILGTGGALSNACKYIVEENFFLINSDIFHSVNLRDLADFHFRHGRIATLVVEETQKDYLRQVAFDPENRITGIANIMLAPASLPPTHVFIGIHAINKKIFDYCTENREKCIIRDVYRSASQNGELLMAFNTDAFWNDIGDIEGYRNIHEAYLTGKI